MSRIGVAIIMLAILWCCPRLSSQTTFQPKPVEYNLKGVVYEDETLWEIRAHAQGFSLAHKKGKLKSYYKTTYQNFEIGYIKDRREKRTSKNLAISGERLSSAFVYGKAHEFFQLRYSRGVKQYLSEKTRRRGLAVGWIYEGGLTLGLLKPYHITVIRTEGPNPNDRFLEELSYDEELDSDFLNEQLIYGGAGTFSGWGGVRPTVGLHGKIALHWSLGAFDAKERAFETGVMVDVFPQKVPILIEREGIANDFYFAKLYVAFQFGHRTRRGEEE